MPNVGPWELILLVVVLLLVFGSRRLPEIGRSVGKGMREFKNSVTGKDEQPLEQEEKPAELTARAVEEEDEQPVSAGSKQTGD
jgi:sec-independent protein translocase protein TatA